MTDGLVRTHLSKSLKEVHGGLRGWVSRRPEWLQPPLYGALLVYGLILWRGGIVALPIGVITYAFGSAETRGVVGPILLAGLVYAPGAGFLGGLGVAILRPLLRRLGALGKYVETIFGVWVYCAVLVFVIVPILKPADKVPITSPVGWILSGIMGIVFVLALMTTDRDNARRAQDPQRPANDVPPSGA